MTRLPQLEAQLVAAAGVRRPRARRPLLITAGALAVAACVIAALLLAPASEPQRRERPVTVPETVPAATLVKARALTKQPAAAASEGPGRGSPRRRSELWRRRHIHRALSDHFDWAERVRLPDNPRAFSAPSSTRVLPLGQYWVHGADRAGATAVLAQIPYWPTQRRKNRPSLLAEQDPDRRCATATSGTMRQEANSTADQVRARRRSPRRRPTPAPAPRAPERPGRPR